MSQTAHQADVLIIGGGMAAAWAAVAAVEGGASVIIVDKGYVGTSGVTATGGPNHWWVAPDQALRREAIERQTAKAQGLGDPEWMERIIDLTYRYLPTLAPFYLFGSDGKGGIYYSGVRGSEYMRALRDYALSVGVVILDHHPALELLTDEEGRIQGARGHALRTRQDWEIRAGATILATGGVAFRSGLLGSHTNTGDGALMAAEAGAELSGMEFGPSWSISPAWASTRTLPYTAARYFDAAGQELNIPPPRTGHLHNQALGRALLAGEVFADLSEAPAELKPILHHIQPLTPAPFVRRGIDPFKDRFPVKLFGEGTIRGTGGLRLIDTDCRTSVRGLFAVGDAATRELVAGAASGGGAVNAAWALSSGRIAGAAAAREGKGRKPTPIRALGQLGFHPTSDSRAFDLPSINARINHEIHGYDQALWRREATLRHSAGLLDTIWRDLARHGQAKGADLVALRETIAMAANARWSTAAALARTESRGLHERFDHQATDPRQASRLLVSGLDALRVVAENPELEPA